VVHCFAERRPTRLAAARELHEVYRSEDFVAGHSKWANIQHRKGRSGGFANALNVHSRR
jgi:hypothetical protein